MAELILTIILSLSLIGMGVILFRKMPVLVKLPEVSEGFHVPLVLKTKREVKNLPGLRSFSYELYLQKILSKVRILTLKTENKTGSWLENLRQKNNQKNHSDNDKYWDELKKAKDGK